MDDRPELIESGPGARDNPPVSDGSDSTPSAGTPDAPTECYQQQIQGWQQEAQRLRQQVEQVQQQNQQLQQTLQLLGAQSQAQGPTKTPSAQEMIDNYLRGDNSALQPLD